MDRWEGPCVRCQEPDETPCDTAVVSVTSGVRFGPHRPGSTASVCERGEPERSKDTRAHPMSGRQTSSSAATSFPLVWLEPGSAKAALRELRARGMGLIFASYH